MKDLQKLDGPHLNNIRLLCHYPDHIGHYIAIGDPSSPIHRIHVKLGECYSMNFNVPAYDILGNSVMIEHIDLQVLNKNDIRYCIKYRNKDNIKCSSLFCNRINLFYKDPRPYMTRAGRILYGSKE